MEQIVPAPKPKMKIVKLKKGQKHPMGDDWQKRAIEADSDDGKQILQWVERGYVNYGVHTGASELFIHDVDPKNGADPEKYLRELPPTYTVRTPSGGLHFYYHWADSLNYSGRRTPYLPDGETKEPGIDFLVGNTQAVGAGSVVNGKAYEVLRDLPIAEISPPLIAKFMTARERDGHGTPTMLETGDVSEGRNNSLTRQLGQARKNGLRDEDVWAFLVGANNTLADPLSEHELRTTIYVSAMKWATGDEEILTETIGDDGEAKGYILNANDLPYVGEKPIRWIVDDFIPEGELVILWGAPKVGKSTLCSWVAAMASRQQKHVLFVGAGEERADVFAAKFRESGGDMDYFHFANASMIVKFPKNQKFFADQIRDKQFGFVYFDSLRATMDSNDKQNEADRSRSALQPLAIIAQEVGVTTMLTTHPMKARSDSPVEIMLGSTELKAVARVVLHVQAGEAENNFFVKVDQTNMRKPDVDLHVIRSEKPFCDHRTGAVQMEIREDGSSRPVMIPYIESVTRVTAGTGAVAKQSPTNDDTKERYEAFEKAWNDGAVRNPEEAQKVLGISRASFYRFRSRITDGDNIQVEVAS